MALALGTNVGFVTVAPTADPAGTGATSDGSSFVVKDTAPTGAILITEVGWYKSGGTTSSNTQVGLYSDSAGVADARLQVTGDAASGTSADVWVRFTGLNWPITAGTAYWLGMQQDAHTGSSTIDSAASGGSGIDTRTSQTALTNPYGGGAVSDADGMYAIYAVYQSAPTVVLNSPADAASTGDLTPTLNFTGTDAQSDDIRYNVQLSTSTFADITLGNVGTHTDSGSGDTTAFDSGTGSNRILIFGASLFDTTGADRQISSVTYGGEALTKVTGAVADNGTSNGRAEIWYRVAPLTGSNNLSVTFAGANDITNADYFYAIFNNVDQSNPINDSDNHTTVAGTQDRITLTTTNIGEMLVDVNNGDAGGQTLGSGQTSLMDLSGSTGRGSYKLATSAGNYNMDMNTGANDNYAHAAISLKPSNLVLTNAVSGTDSGFSGSPDNTDPFASAQAVDYTVQSDLTASTVYYWRVRGIDPTGSNTYGAWATTRSFTATAGGVTVKTLAALGVG